MPPMKTELVGPPPRAIGDTVNPSRPDDFGWVDLLIHAVPYLHGGAIGVIEGLARKGSFETWAQLNDYIKATVLAVIGGVAEFVEEQYHRSSPRLARAMCKLSGAATSHGIAYAVAAGIGGQSGEMVSKSGWKYDPNTGQALSGYFRETMSSTDAQAADRAVRELVRRRKDINAAAAHTTADEAPVPVDGIPFGEDGFTPIRL